MKRKEYKIDMQAILTQEFDEAIAQYQKALYNFNHANSDYVEIANTLLTAAILTLDAVYAKIKLENVTINRFPYQKYGRWN